MIPIKRLSLMNLEFVIQDPTEEKVNQELIKKISEIEENLNLHSAAITSIHDKSVSGFSLILFLDKRKRSKYPKLSDVKFNLFLSEGETLEEAYVVNDKKNDLLFESFKPETKFITGQTSAFLNPQNRFVVTTLIVTT